MFSIWNNTKMYVEKVNNVPSNNLPLLKSHAVEVVPFDTLVSTHDNIIFFPFPSHQK